MKWWRGIVAMTWELPQTLLAIIVFLMTHGYGKKNTVLEYATVYWRVAKGWGVSLGAFIFLGKLYDLTYSEDVVMEIAKHEHGHSIQSLYLGPLYLIVIGLPSMMMNLLTRLGILSFERYYDRWPENWANKLGNVDVSKLN